jgi:hypothetical protein
MEKFNLCVSYTNEFGMNVMTVCQTTPIFKFVPSELRITPVFNFDLGHFVLSWHSYMFTLPFNSGVTKNQTTGGAHIRSKTKKWIFEHDFIFPSSL